MWKIPPLNTHHPHHPPLTLWPLSLTSRWALTLAWGPETQKQSHERFFFFHRRGEHLAVWMRLWLSSIVWLLGLIHCYGRLSRGPKWFALTAALFASFPLTLGEIQSPKYESVVGHSMVSSHWILCFGNRQSCCWDKFSFCVQSIISFLLLLWVREQFVSSETRHIALMSNWHFGQFVEEINSFILLSLLAL